MCQIIWAPDALTTVTALRIVGIFDVGRAHGADEMDPRDLACMLTIYRFIVLMLLKQCVVDDHAA